MKAPICDGKIKMADAIDIVAGIVYPDKVNSDKDARRKAKKAVQEHIRRAFETGVFGRMHYSKAAQIDEAEFYTWARAQKKWHALSQVEGLPRHTISGCMSAQEADDTIEASGIEIPETKEKLKEHYIETMRKLAKDEKYLEAIQPDLAELAERRRKEKETSVKRAKAGGEGGRSRTK